MNEIEINDLIDPLLIKIENECEELKNFIKTKDFPYHKSHYYSKVIEHASAMLLLAGEIKALHKMDNEFSIKPHAYTDTKEQIIDNLKDCST